MASPIATPIVTPMITPEITPVPPDDKDEKALLPLHIEAKGKTDPKPKVYVITPEVSAIDQWSYDEVADVETLEASDGGTYTFRKQNKTPRKIYFSMKIKRFSDIDNVRESFRVRYHLYLNWIITKKEYETYLSFKKAATQKKKRMKWEPKFKPRIEFVNNVEEHYFEAVDYPPDGAYRVQVFTNWMEESQCGFDCRKTLFCRQKLECDYTFSEQMELRSFPFDCQDFTIKIRESCGTKRALLLPESRFTNSKRIRKSNFFKLDPTFSIIDEWDFHSIILEIADSSSGASRSKSVYHEITIRLKLKRRWKVYLYNVIFYFMIITFLSLTCFALDANDIGERLNLAVIILLTLVAFQHTVFSKLPNIPYLTFMHKYIIISFIFVCVVILESSFVPIASTGMIEEIEYHIVTSGGEILPTEIGNTQEPKKDFVHRYTGFAFDVTMSWLFTLCWFGYHIFFILRSAWHRHVQSQKLTMDSDEIGDIIDEKYPQFLLSWKSLLDFKNAKSYQHWQQQESITEVQRQLQESDKEQQEKKKKTDEKERGKLKAHCVMSFGGDRGEILTFTSYAQKDVFEEFTFCGLVRHGLSTCFKSCASVICCECCRGEGDTNKSIKKTKSDAFDHPQI